MTSPISSPQSKYGPSGRLIAISIGGCALLIASALFVLGTLFNDLNSLYEQIHLDMDEFRGFADDAWRQMMKDPAVASQVLRVTANMNNQVLLVQNNNSKAMEQTLPGHSHQNPKVRF